MTSTIGNISTVEAVLERMLKAVNVDVDEALYITADYMKNGFLETYSSEPFFFKQPATIKELAEKLLSEIVESQGDEGDAQDDIKQYVFLDTEDGEYISVNEDDLREYLGALEA